MYVCILKKIRKKINNIKVEVSGCHGLASTRITLTNTISHRIQLKYLSFLLQGHR